MISVFFRRLREGQFSLGKRLSTIFFFTNAITILCSFLAFTTVLITFSLRSFVAELRAVTTVIASTSRASLAFGDRQAGERILVALREKDNVAYAALVDREGEIFAEYGIYPKGLSAIEPSDEAFSWTLDYVLISTPVILDGEQLGTITAVGRLESFYRQVGLLFLVGIAVTVVAGTATYFFARLLTLWILKPLDKLKNLAHEVSVTKDFSMRLEPVREDEVNELIQALNYMLHEIEVRDRSLSLAKERAEQADRAKSAFVANVSHELRTPMHAIQGMTDELLRTGLSEEQRDLLSTVRNSGDSLLSIINDILDFSKIEASKLTLSPSDFRLREFLEMTMKMFEHSFRSKQIDHSLTISPDAPEVVQADKGRLSQILVNLIGNALKFTDDGGRIELFLDLDKSAKVPTSHVRLVFNVIDSGVGIPAEQIDTIFDSFVQAKGGSRSVQGTGLGLAIVYRLTKLMGGDVWVESTEGKGSKFSVAVVVPIAVETSETGKERAVSGSLERPHRGEGKERVVILIVEDNTVNQKLAARILTNDGFEVQIAEHGLECIEKMKSNKIDLILMDVNMPVMDGIVATRTIRSSDLGGRENLPIIGLTAQVSSDCTRNCLEAGMNTVLTKPISRTLLLAEIYRFLRNRAAPSLVEPELTQSHTK